MLHVKTTCGHNAAHLHMLPCCVQCASQIRDMILFMLPLSVF